MVVVPVTSSTSDVVSDDDSDIHTRNMPLGNVPASADRSEPEGFSAVEFAHHDLLNEVLDDGSSASDRILRSYKRSLNGFAAKLTEEEVLWREPYRRSIRRQDPPLLTPDSLAGAAGVVFVTREPDIAVTLYLTGLAVTQDKFDQIMAYVNSTSNPVGTIDRTETIVNPQAPVPASSSSGPNLITPSILKPDLSAPGVDIIASWSPLSSHSANPNNTRKVQYNIISGTSMACPHASGAAAYIKSLHRDWSPAMIMSALITTAIPMNTPGNSNMTALKYGAGQLNPVKAHDPGLVYDALESDYVDMLCAQGYNTTQLALITGYNMTACTNGSTSSSPSDLNYPTMAAHVEPGKNFTVVFPRTATNVGAASAVYNVKVVLPIEAANDLTIDVSPSRLEFSAQGQKVSFAVAVSGVVMEDGNVHSAAIVWYNNEHEVRSPVVVYAT